MWECSQKATISGKGLTIYMGMMHIRWDSALIEYVPKKTPHFVIVLRKITVILQS